MDARSRRVTIIVLTMTAICACGSRVDPVTRTPLPSETAPASAPVLVADLTYQPATVPAPDGFERGCVGVVMVTIDPTPRGTFLTGAAWFVVAFIACPPGTVVTNVYVRRNDASGYNTWIGANVGEVVLRDGNGTFRFVNQGIPMSRVEALLARPSDFGVGVNSQRSPNGLLYGDLRAR